jgi:hypothetical protein
MGGLTMDNTVEIVLTKNVCDNPVYAFVIKGNALYNPNYSECGRFKVDAFKEYGLLPLQVKALHDLNNAFNFNDEV